MTAVVIDGHPNPDSLCTAIASRYAAAYGDARLLTLRDLDFDVHMRFGYTRRMPIEPDLTDARQAIRDASHVVVVTPVWWRSTPALLKGFLDRALLPQEDFRYNDHGMPEGLLKGRSGRVIATSDTPGWLSHALPDTRLRQLRRGTLAFCGIKPVAFTFFGSVRTTTPETRAGWLDEVARLARKDAIKAPRSIAAGVRSVVGGSARAA